MDITSSALIRVLAGKDKGNYLMVYKVLDNNYVLICDGKLRKIEKPKKKKIKHIESLNYSLIEIKEKFEKGKEIKNSDIRKSIKSALAELGIEREE